MMTASNDRTIVHIKVLHSAERHVTREADKDEPFDRDDTATDHHVSGLEIVEGRSFWDLIVDYEVGEDRPYHLLYAVYSTGDSFGRDDGDKILFFDLYEKAEDAERAREQIEACEGTIMSYTASNGTTTTTGCPWSGYFESLDYVRVDSFPIPPRRVAKSTPRGVSS